MNLRNNIISLRHPLSMALLLSTLEILFRRKQSLFYIPFSLNTFFVAVYSSHSPQNKNHRPLQSVVELSIL